MKYIIVTPKDPKDIRDEYDSRLIETEVTAKELEKIVHDWHYVNGYDTISHTVTLDICNSKRGEMYFSVEEDYRIFDKVKRLEHEIAELEKTLTEKKRELEEMKR